MSKRSIHIGVTVLFLLLSQSCSPYKSEEECIQRELKGTSEVAYAAAADYCAPLFPAPDKTATSKPYAVSARVCHVYWDGWKFVRGEAKIPEYKTYGADRYGVEALKIDMPPELAETLAPSGKLDTKNPEFRKIMNICEFVE